jgi:hypothetical protein
MISWHGWDKMYSDSGTPIHFCRSECGEYLVEVEERLPPRFSTKKRSTYTINVEHRSIRVVNKSGVTNIKRTKKLSRELAEEYHNNVFESKEV